MSEGNNGLEPIILGTLRKQKSSKPFFVLLVFLLVFGVLFFIEDIQDYVKNPNTFLGGIYYSVFGYDEADPNYVVINNDTIHTLNAKTEIPFDNIVLSKVTLDNYTITYSIRVKGESIELDKEELYLEIYGAGTKLLRRIKLTGTITTAEEIRTFTFKDFKFAANFYQGRLHRMSEDEYDNVVFADGVSSFTCASEGNSYTYNFDNYQLKTVKHTYRYTDLSVLDVYIGKLEEYTTLAKKISTIPNCTASALEEGEGFIFTAELNLASLTQGALGTAPNYDYQTLDKQAKIVKYEMKTKGFECR